MLVEDCRGLACPTPVIKTKQTLMHAGGDPIRVLVDNGAPRENVARFAKTHGCTVEEEPYEDGWQLTLFPASIQQQQQQAIYGQQPVLLIGSDRLGDGPDELGRLLMKNFIITLLDIPVPPEAVFFINSGVHLTTAGSELLEPLHKLTATGTGVFSCGICLDYFGLRDKLAVGSITNMYTIAERMLAAGNPLTL